MQDLEVVGLQQLVREFGKGNALIRIEAVANAAGSVVRMLLLEQRATLACPWPSSC